MISDQRLVPERPLVEATSMRHGLSGRQLSRNSTHRSAMLRNMAASLLRHEAIRTTVPKAKELRRFVEPLITLGKTDSQANRRRAFARLRDAEVVDKLFDDLGPRFKARPGGYTRILHMANRAGDNADMALMALVDKAVPAEAKAGGRREEAEGPQEEGCRAGGRGALRRRPRRSRARRARRRSRRPERAAHADAKRSRVIPGFFFFGSSLIVACRRVRGLTPPTDPSSHSPEQRT